MITHPRHKKALIEKPQLFEKIGYTPHSDLQQRAHESSARFRIPCCGRRWGKTTFAAAEALSGLFIPDTWYWIVGPDYSLTEKEFRQIRHALLVKLGLGKEVRISYNPKQGDMSIRMPWNTTLECKSARHKDTLLGEGLDGVIMSEAATHTVDIWEQYIEPALSDKLGWAIFPSTPRGYNWYHGLWKMGEVGEPDYASWRFPSWTNPIAYPGGRTDAEIVRIEKTVSPMFFAQEYAAEFTSFVGKIYDEFRYDLHVTDIDYNPEWKNFWAFDWGFSAPWVCLDIMVDPMDNVYVWREYQVRYKSTWEHGGALKSRPSPEGFHVDSMFGDPRGADEIATLALVLGYVIGNPVGWKMGVESVKRHLALQDDGRPKLFIDKSCTELIRQMEGLRANDAPRTGEKNPKEGQHDYDDHGPDALRYFFSEYFVRGANAHLDDAYNGGYMGSESETFFKLNSSFSLGDRPMEYKW